MMRFHLGFLEYSRLALSFDGHRFLDDREENTLKALKTHRARQSFLAGRILAKSLVADLTNRPAEDVTISVDEAGKPGVDSGKPVFFSIAHSGGWAACAVSVTPLGLDLEKRSRKRDWRAVAEAYFHPAEREDMGRIFEPEEMSRYFHRLWTVKEAYIKAHGLTVWDLGRLPRIRRRRFGSGESANALSFELNPDLFLGLYSPSGIHHRDIVPLPRFPGPEDDNWSAEGFIVDTDYE